MNGCIVSFSSNSLAVFLPNFLEVRALSCSCSEKPIKWYMLSAVVTVKASVMDLVENVANARNLEAVVTEPCSHPTIDNTSQGNSNMHICGQNDKCS